MRFWFLSAMTSLLILPTLRAQDANPGGGVADIRIHSDLVLINALVTDRHGTVITALDASRFRLFDDGQEQTVKYCVSEDAPVSIGLVIDTSGSMGEKLDVLKQAAIQFVRAANPADEYFIVEFQNHPKVAVPFTDATDQVLGEIARIQAGGQTALFDAVQLAVQEMKKAGNTRKALLIVSDGIDNHSRHSERSTRRLVSEIDFPIYSINVWQPQYGNRYAIQRRDPETLESISAPTGGRAFAVRDLKKLPAVTELISLEIRHEYVLGYVPPNHVSDGMFHKIRINVDTDDRLRISNRAGYYAPVH
jgi:Ca-activated chloride channel family protein